MKLLFRLIGILKKIYRNIFPTENYEQWYKLEKEGEFTQVSKERKEFLKNSGFNVFCEVIYDFDTYDPIDYITCRDYYKLHPLNKTFSKLIDYKPFLPVLLKGEPQFLPSLQISIEEGELKYFEGVDVKENMAIDQVIEQAIVKYEDIFIKPSSDSGGSNTMILEQSGDINGQVKKMLKQFSNLVISNRLQSEKYSKQIYSDSLNTYRVIIYKNKGYTPKIFRIFHRFGTSYSGNVDNCDKGGMVCEIDVETGVMGRALIYGKQEIAGRYDNHIDSNVKLNGYQIPNWNSKLDEIDQILQQLSYLEYGGLDIAPTTEGLKVIEINSLPSPRLTQMNRPAFIDPDFKAYFAKKGYFAL